MNSSASNDFFGLDFDYQDVIEGRQWMDVPEQRLIWAIIERCVRDALGNQISDVKAAIDWLWADASDDSESFSFHWCCETLGIDPDALREKIVRMRENLGKSGLECKAA